MIGRAGRAALLAVAMASGAATCGPGGPPGDPQTYAEASDVVFCSPRNKVDILFVIDDGPQMVVADSVLVNNIAAYADVLEGSERGLQYRVGFTTASVLNPACDADDARNGSFEARSCLQRLEAFVDPSEPTTGVAGCSEVCSLESLDLLPTTTHLDDTPRARPWIERRADGTNLPAGVTAQEAFACLGLQGWQGCRFASPLEAARLALQRTQDPNAPEYGFFRPEALPVVVFVTASNECSHAEGYGDIFTTDGDRVFWSDPMASEATSAVCWNAGVTCSGGPDVYDECHAQAHGADGEAIGVTGGTGVLEDVWGYVALWQTFEDERQSLFPDQELQIVVTAGVPPGYAEGQDIAYQDTADPVFQDRWGIGPGCSSAAAEAPPPVRLREFAERFELAGQRNLHSVCDNDHSDDLGVLVQGGDQIPPACFEQCVADQDPETPELDPHCVAVSYSEVPEGLLSRTVPACEEGPDGPRLPDGARDCWAPVLGDDRSIECVDGGWNLQVQVLADPDAPNDAGCVEVTCLVSPDPAVDCPDAG